MEAGFDYACLWQVDKLGKRFWKPLLRIENRFEKSQKTTIEFGDDEYGPEIIVDHIEQFMESPNPEHFPNKDQPFFIYYPMILVHSPFIPTPPQRIPGVEKTSRRISRTWWPTWITSLGAL